MQLDFMFQQVAEFTVALINQDVSKCHQNITYESKSCVKWMERGEGKTEHSVFCRNYEIFNILVLKGVQT